jgi:hypothetical protein
MNYDLTLERWFMAHLLKPIIPSTLFFIGLRIQYRTWSNERNITALQSPNRVLWIINFLYIMLLVIHPRLQHTYTCTSSWNYFMLWRSEAKVSVFTLHGSFHLTRATLNLPSNYPTLCVLNNVSLHGLVTFSLSVLKRATFRINYDLLHNAYLWIVAVHWYEMVHNNEIE